LKLQGILEYEEAQKASPGLKAGRGLKLSYGDTVRAGSVHRPASRPGAD